MDPAEVLTRVNNPFASHERSSWKCGRTMRPHKLACFGPVLASQRRYPGAKLEIC